MSALLSPTLPEAFVSLSRCLTFIYKVQAHSTALTVSTFLHIHGNLLNRKTLWESAINNADGWSKAYVTIPNGYYHKFGFEIHRKQSVTDDVYIAIDNIELFNGNCF